MRRRRRMRPFLLLCAAGASSVGEGGDPGGARIVLAGLGRGTRGELYYYRPKSRFAFVILVGRSGPPTESVVQDLAPCIRAACLHM